MGGSDTYGVTIQVIKLLKKFGKKATILLGPAFSHWPELKKELNSNFTIKRTVPSLIAEFKKYDLAITGGGVTPFLACLVS
jgi:spore coat polysaccharide biosynthesis predicted glycosyltransferase SpsG